MATPQELAQSAQDLMDQLKNVTISFEDYQNTLNPIKTEYENRKNEFATDENESFGNIISSAISLMQGDGSI